MKIFALIITEKDMRQDLSAKRLALLLVVFAILVWAQIAAADDQDAAQPLKHVMTITEGLGSPLRIAIDDRDVVYVTDAIGGRICKYDSAGTFLGAIPVGASPLAIAVTPEHLLYIGDRVTGELRLLDSEGSLIKTIASEFGKITVPSCAALDDENRLYVVDSRGKCVHVFDGRGEYVGAIGETTLTFPTSIAFDKKNQRILVAEHGGLSNGGSETGHMIHVFDKRGARLASFGEYGDQKGQFTRIQGIDVDRLGRIYVSDSYQGVVTMLSEQGAFRATVGQFGRNPGELRAPMDVAVDPHDRLWVASMNNGSLEVYEIGDIPTSIVDEAEASLPTQNELLQNYPNPFNPVTRIPFNLKNDSHVSIHIYNEMGQRVRTFDLGKRKPGSYSDESRAVYWDGADDQGRLLASGVYLYEIRAEGFVAVRRMLLLK